MARTRRFVALAAALAVSGGLSVAPPGAAAGVTGSPHDFSPTGPSTNSPAVAPGGACFACHLPHRAPDAYVLWSRDLASYRANLANNGVPSSVPDYVLPPAIPCYDCHDFHGGGGIDDVPSLSLFAANHRPQDIAFGFRKSGTGSMTEDAPGGTVSGYYENKPPAGSSTYGADPGLDPSDNVQLLKTGGHYFKYRDPTGISGDGFDVGDKLPCRDCHDPHAWSGNWQAFIRPNLGGTTGWNRITPSGQPTASTFMANEFTSGGARNDADSRTLCIACHGDSDSRDAVNFSDIGARYSGSAGRIVRPPASIPAHGSGSQAACVSCHGHNAIDAACNVCHSYPGQDNATSPKQMSAGHWDHVGRPLAGGTDDSRGYACELCHHNYAPGHNQNNYAPGQAWGASYYTNVSIRFDNTWNPGPVTYNGQEAGTTAAAGNGGTGVCAGLYCHGNDATRNAGWAGSAPLPAWNGSAACGACHDAGSADTTPGTTPSSGNHPAHLAEAYGPGISAFTADGNCSEGTGCHTAYGLAPDASHANNQADFRGSPADNAPVLLGATQICRNCHSTFASSAGTGDDLVRTRANWSNAAYKAPCVTCHNDAPAANSPPDAQSTAGLDGSGGRAADIDAYFYTGGGHGDNSINNTATPVSPSAVLCTSCHDASLAHIGTSKDATNPWRLSEATNFALNGGLDDSCATACHAAGAPADHSWRVDVTAPIAAESKGETDTHPTSIAAVGTGKERWYRVPADDNVPLQGNLTQWPHAKSESENIVCVSCHDPHGVGTTVLPAAIRSFSGRITDVPRRMLRYDYSSGGGAETTLCAKCHI